MKQVDSFLLTNEQIEIEYNNKALYYPFNACFFEVYDTYISCTIDNKYQAIINSRSLDIVQKYLKLFSKLSIKYTDKRQQVSTCPTCKVTIYKGEGKSTCKQKKCAIKMQEKKSEVFTPSYLKPINVHAGFITTKK